MTTISQETELRSHVASPNSGLQLMRRLRKFVDLRTLAVYVLMIIASAFFVFPLVWMGGTSLKTIEQANQSQLTLFPPNPQWSNYQKLFGEETFYRSYINSIFVTGLVLFGTVTSISIVSYAFSRLEWRGRNIIFALMLGTLMLPAQATLVPQYVLYYNLGWIRTFNPITIPGFFAGGAALIFLMRQFMMTLPKELDEAAELDGAGPLQIWWYIIMPLARPAVATITVFLFVGQWNNLLNPLLYLQRAELFTMPVYVAQKLNLQESPIPWQDIMAASVTFVLPVLVVFMLTQRYFIEGITLTGSKG
jgi:multiple sugar transport system permease protein